MNNHSTAANHPSRRWIILATCCLSLFLVTMDVTIVNVALPSIRADLHAGVAGLQWSIDGYTVVVASLLLLSGSTADRFGRRRTFQVGLAVFSLGSLLCSLAPTTGALVAFRMLQAVGGSMLNPVAMSIIVNTFTDPAERARAIGLWGAVFGVSMGVGPVLGGALIETLGWRSIFWVNVPLALLAIVLTARFIPESRAPRARRFDFVGQALVIVALLALTSAVIEGRRAGWGSPAILARFAVTAASVAGLIAWERRRREPLLDLRFFRSVPFSAATVTAVLAFAGFSGFLFLNSLYLQEGRDLRASVAGLMTLPIAVALGIASPISGRLVGAGRTRAALFTAGSCIAAGALLLAGLSNHTPLWHLAIAYAVFGTGHGLVNAPITNTAVSGMPLAQAGVASAVASTSRQIGATLGVALAGSLAGAGIDSAHRADYGESMRVVFWIIAALGAAVAAIGVASTGKRSRATADGIAHLLDDAPRALTERP